MALDTICFWDVAKWGMREVYGAEPLNIPVMKPRVGDERKKQRNIETNKNKKGA